MATIAPMTPAAAPRFVTTATSAKRPPMAPSVEPALKPNQPNHRMSTDSPTSGGPGFEPNPAEPQDEHRQPDQRHRVAGDDVRRAVLVVLAAPRAQVQQ